MDTKHAGLTATRFFKVLMPGFHQKLNLPPAVSKELEQCKSQTAILESRLGRWKMGVCRNEEIDVICFKQGWPEFVRRHSLRIGDFLVFEPTDLQLHFNVYVFDSSACEEEFRGGMKKARTEAPPFFLKTMMPIHATLRGKVNIPVEFMRLNNLGKQKSVCLRDPRRKAWMVTLELAKNGLRLRMSTGWLDFYASNALKNGDTCVFNLIRPNLTRSTIVLDVHILRAT